MLRLAPLPFLERRIMTLKNAPRKGREFELKVAKLIRDKVDKDCKRMFRSGAVAHFPEDIYTKLPLHIECKNQEKIKLWKWWDETLSRNRFGKDPVLVITSNHRPILAVVEIEYLLNLLKVQEDYIADIKE